MKWNKTDIEIILKGLIHEEVTLTFHDPNKILEGEYQSQNLGKKVLVMADAQIPNTLSNDQFDYVLDLFNNRLIGWEREKRFYVINNPDGTVRWAFPKGLNVPSFLSLYNSSSLKANIYKQVVKLAFKFKFQSLLSSGKFHLYYNQELAIQSITSDLNCEGYSIFTGTVGPNRKVLIELSKQGYTKFFIKYPLNEQSKKLVRNEAKALELLSDLTFEPAFKFPEIVGRNESYIIISNIKPQRPVSTHEFAKAHHNALRGLYKINSLSVNFNRSKFCEDIDDYINALPKHSRFDQGPVLYASIRKLRESLKSDQAFHVGWSHGDFTPWNMYCKDGEAYVYDWELSASERPMLFDLFHYIFQSSVLICKHTFESIVRSLYHAIYSEDAQAVIHKYNLDPGLYLKLYILHTVSYYAGMYEKQERLHTQAYWLMEFWSELLLSSLNQGLFPNSMRKSFISQFAEKVGDWRHACLKMNGQSLDQIDDDSDIDILICKREVDDWIHYIETHQFVRHIQAFQKSYMCVVKVYFWDGTFLSIDLIFEFKRKSLFYLKAKKMLKNTSVFPNGVKHPLLEYDFEYIFLFYHLNGADIPPKYQTYFESLDATKRARILNYINKQYDTKYASIKSVCEHHNTTALKLKRKAIRLNVKNVNPLSKLSYLIDTLKERLFQKGTVVTFSGVDGAGKTTILNQFMEDVSTKYRRKVVMLRHRPSILPILSAWKYGKAEAEQKSMAALPRTGKNQSKMGSLLRFAYYYVDYFFGQFWVHLKYVSRGYVVVYDRYYFDFINDAKRSNIIISDGIVKFLFGFIMKPSLNVFLYADPEIILKRKQELSASDIKSLTEKYRSLFNQLDRGTNKPKYLQLENIHIEQTMQTLMHSFNNILTS